MTAENIEKLSFEEALTKLEQIVGNLESGKDGLEESIKSYEQGIALKKHCEKKLREAQEKIEKIVVSPDGEVSTEPFGE